MPVNYIHSQRYTNHFGLDLKSDDLDRAPQFASSMINAQYTKEGDIEKRKGFEGYAEDLVFGGVFTYARMNPTTGKKEFEVVGITDKAHKLLEATMTVTYTGSDAVCLISIFFDDSTDQYRCQILEDVALVLDEPLGKGFDEGGIVDVASLTATITALTDFTATATGVTTVPAAFLKTVLNHDLSSSGGPLDAIGGYWSAINTTVSSPLAGTDSNKNDLDWEIASAVNLVNNLYVANGYDEAHKYDGQTFYRAGLPSVASISGALGVAGAITGTDYLHLAQYIQHDASGNIYSGNFLKTTTGLSPTAETMDVTVANVLDGSGFNTNCAIVDGAQVTVNTITADNGSGGFHTMKVGDTAYFFDSVTGDYVEREVTGITGSSLTVAGAAVTVADNAVISNNLRIGIYRTPSGGGALFNLVAEIPNDSFSSTQVFNDNVVDASLGVEFIEPLTDRSPPPKGKYISSFQNLLVIAGKLDQPRTTFYSDIDFPEYFPADSNSFDTDPRQGDRISGIGTNNEIFAVFLEHSIYTVAGNVAEGTIRVDELSSDIGCGAHASIKEVRGNLYWWSDKGPYRMSSGQIPRPLGELPQEGKQPAGRLEPVLDQEGVADNEFLYLKRAVSLHDRKEELYITHLPAESVGAGDRYSNSNSRSFAYDYARDAWLEWDTINMSGGATQVDSDQTYWAERRFSTFNNSVDNILYRRHDLNDAFDYQDHAEPISLDYGGNWEALGAPEILKRYLRTRLFSLGDLPNNELQITVEVETNYIRDLSQGSFLYEFGGEGYGIAEYGDAAYGDPQESALKHRLVPGRWRSLRLRFKNSNHQQNVKLSGWTLEIAPRYKPVMKT